MDPQRQIISSRLQDLRAQRGMTQESVARMADISWRHYQVLESGRSTPRWSTLEKLAEVFGVDPMDITGERRTSAKRVPDKEHVAQLQLKLHQMEQKLNRLTHKVSTIERAS